MEKIKILRDALIVSLALCIFLGIQYYIAYMEKESAESALIVQQINSKVLTFNKLFIDKVLSSTNEVSFEDRLRLENSIRDLNDPEIFSEWQNFVNSQTESSAQGFAKKLLSLLGNKISY